MIFFYDDIERRGPTNAKQRRALRRLSKRLDKEVTWTELPSGARYGTFLGGCVISTAWKSQDLAEVCRWSGQWLNRPATVPAPTP